MQPSGAGHRIGQLRLRTSAPSRPARLPLLNIAAHTFVRGLLQQHASQDRRLPMLEQTVRRPMMMTVFLPVYQRSDLHFAPRLALTVRGSMQLPGRASHGIPGMTASGTARSEHVTLLSLVMRITDQSANRQVTNQRAADHHGGRASARLARVITLVQRLTTRQQRIESVRATPESLYSGDRDPLAVTRNAHAAGRPIPLVIHRSQPLPAAHDPMRNDGGAAPANAARSSPSWQPPHHVTPVQGAPVNLDDLTDHVVAAINRRIIAQRERFGRG